MSGRQGDDLSRRDFLLRLSGLLAAAYALNQPSVAKSPALSQNYPISRWTGDDFTLGHRMRSGDGPRLPQRSEGKVDFVIVGGGMAGLTSAYKLRHENFILLEQYDDLGGTARGKEHKGLWYSMGAAYYSQEEGPVAQLVQDCGLKPAVLLPDKNNFYFQNKWVSGVEGPNPNLLYRNFKRLRADIAPVMKQISGDGPSLPVTNPSLLKLDSINFASMLTGYDLEFRQFVDRILMSSACADSELTNALAGSILANDFFDKSFVLPGGNPALARAMVGSLEKTSSVDWQRSYKDGQSPKNERLKRGCFVWAVEMKDGGASVVYSDKAGHMKRIDCKHVILATLPLVSGRILTGVKNESKASLFWFRYGSYLVANVICKKRVFKGTYDNFVPPPFAFTDIVEAEASYLKTNTYKESMGSVLTVYRPWQPGTMGRSVLQDGNQCKLASELVDAMGTFIPDLQDNIEKIVMTRWGHAISVAQRHYYERITKVFANQGEYFTLSHSSLQGIQCMESAVQAGIMAANRALKVKSKK